MALYSSSPSLDDTFTKRLRMWRAAQNFTQAEAAKVLGIDRGYYSQVEIGNRTPGKSLRDRFELAERALAPTPAAPRTVFDRSFGLRRIPVISWAQAGQPIDFEQMAAESDEGIPTDVANEHAFGVRLRGDSMEPKFSEGDIAILLPGIAATNGEIVVANIKDQGALCKIMHVQLDKKLVKLSSYNPAYPPTEYHRDEFQLDLPRLRHHQATAPAVKLSGPHFG